MNRLDSWDSVLETVNDRRPRRAYVDIGIPVMLATSRRFNAIAAFLRSLPR